MVRKALTVKGVAGRRSSSYSKAIGLIESGRLPLEQLRTIAYPLDRAIEAVEHFAGNNPDDGGICISINPSA
ncbi:hypothetical protein [Rugosimonospora acidiphila]|uniref:hypothetical protein n=1 Tax=Rugosimonospora acidiphila TaxID=556531 RepID=UPI0031EEE13E